MIFRTQQKQSKQLSLPQRADYKTRMSTKYYTAKQNKDLTQNLTNNGSEKHNA